MNPLMQLSILYQIRDQLLEEIAKLSMKIEPDGDFCDQGQAVQEKSKILALRKVKQNRLEEVERAIKRIEVGKYGICENCGNSIDPDRLEVKPETPRCIQCEKKASGHAPLMAMAAHSKTLVATSARVYS